MGEIKAERKFSEPSEGESGRMVKRQQNERITCRPLQKTPLACDTLFYATDYSQTSIETRYQRAELLPELQEPGALMFHNRLLAQRIHLIH